MWLGGYFLFSYLLYIYIFKCLIFSNEHGDISLGMHNYWELRKGKGIHNYDNDTNK